MKITENTEIEICGKKEIVGVTLEIPIPEAFLQEIPREQLEFITEGTFRPLSSKLSKYLAASFLSGKNMSPLIENLYATVDNSLDEAISLLERQEEYNKMNGK